MKAFYFGVFIATAAGFGTSKPSLDPEAVVAERKKLDSKFKTVQTRTYNIKPRVRREWRTLDEEMRNRVATAFWTMANLTTAEGREKYGPHFWNAQDLVVFHVCAVVDPRCDQAHFGPNFMTFHRAYLLLIENSLLDIDPEIEAMPYWQMAFDSTTGKYRNDPEKYIFTDKFFGTYFTTEETNHQVVDGLFKNWAVPAWDMSVYGPGGTMSKTQAVTTCIDEGWFRPAKPGLPTTNKDGQQVYPFDIVDGVKYGQTKKIPEHCEEGCKKDPSTCPLFARADHYDCNKFVTRNPRDPTLSSRNADNTNEITYTEEDFEACTKYENVQTWMEWQNCIEKRIDGVCELRLENPITEFMQEPASPEQRARLEGFIGESVELNVARGGGLSSDLSCNKALTGKSGTWLPLVASCANPSGFYDNYRGRTLVNNLHAQAHLRIGYDMFDTGTSSMDMSAFHGHHANVDRSNMHWQIGVPDTVMDDMWYYPKADQSIEEWQAISGQIPYGTSGPYGTYDMTYCMAADVNYRYTEYDWVNGGPWVKGTTLDEVVAAGFPFFNLFDEYDGGEKGYTHRDILHYTHPSRTPYTYDTLAHHYGLE